MIKDVSQVKRKEVVRYLGLGKQGLPLSRRAKVLLSVEPRETGDFGRGWAFIEESTSANLHERIPGDVPVLL